MRLRKRFTVSLAGGLAAAFVAAGCGGDDDAPTREEFVADANEICAEANQEVDAQAQDLFGGGEEPSQEEFEEFARDVLAPSVRDQVDQIRDLGAPEGDEDEVTEILDTAEAGADEIAEDPEALTRADSQLAEATRLAGEYGLDRCAE